MVVAQSRQLVITASYRIATAREPVLQASANRHAGWHVLRDVTWLGRWHRQVIHQVQKRRSDALRPQQHANLCHVSRLMNHDVP
jgi:hypothetical protein